MLLFYLNFENLNSVQFISLKIFLKKCNINYYYLDKKLIMDFYYDNFFFLFCKFEKSNINFLLNDSINFKISSDIKKGFNFVKHFIPMLSLNSFFSKNELLSFDNHIRLNLNLKNIEYVCEPKIDGLAISLIYKNGYFLRALTRGNGFLGEDVTDSCFMIKDIPFKLNSVHDIPNLLEIRGEIFIFNSDFNKINNILKFKGYSVFKSIRNATVGCLRKLNINILSKQYLKFFAYDIFLLIDNKNYKLSNFHYKNLINIKKLGFRVFDYFKLCNNIYDCINFYKKIFLDKINFNFELDGIVCKLNNISLRKKLGNNIKFPKWAFAYKFYDLKNYTSIKNIKFQMGQSGNLIPIVIVKSIIIFKTRISQVNFSNVNELILNDLRINDKVLIEKIGGIVPKIKNIFYNNRLTNSKKFKINYFCPFCKYKILKIGSHIKCSNLPFCFEYIIVNFKYFLSKDCLNIKGFNLKIINFFVKNKIIKNIYDLYNISYFHFFNVFTVGEKLILKLIKSIRSSREVTFNVFLFSLNINGFGKNSTKKFKFFINIIDNLKFVKKDFLFSLSISKLNIKNIFYFFNKSSNIDLIDALFKSGLIFK